MPELYEIYVILLQLCFASLFGSPKWRED